MVQMTGCISSHHRKGTGAGDAGDEADCVEDDADHTHDEACDRSALLLAVVAGDGRDDGQDEADDCGEDGRRQECADQRDDVQNDRKGSTRLLLGDVLILFHGISPKRSKMYQSSPPWHDMSFTRDVKYDNNRMERSSLPACRGDILQNLLTPVCIQPRLVGKPSQIIVAYVPSLAADGSGMLTVECRADCKVIGW